MKSYNRLLRIIKSFHISEKTNRLKDNFQIIALKILPSATKYEIKVALKKFLFLKAVKVNILKIKGKKKNYGNKLYYKKNWKKAYVKLEKNQNLDLLNNNIR